MTASRSASMPRPRASTTSPTPDRTRNSASGISPISRRTVSSRWRRASSSPACNWAYFTGPRPGRAPRRPRRSRRRRPEPQVRAAGVEVVGEHRQQVGRACQLPVQLLLQRDGRRAGTGGFAADIDNGGALSDHVFRLPERLVDAHKATAVGKGVGGDVHDAPDGGRATAVRTAARLPVRRLDGVGLHGARLLRRAVSRRIPPGAFRPRSEDRPRSATAPRRPRAPAGHSNRAARRGSPGCRSEGRRS